MAVAGAGSGIARWGWSAVAAFSSVSEVASSCICSNGVQIRAEMGGSRHRDEYEVNMRTVCACPSSDRS
jgi:hypothetical protein